MKKTLLLTIISLAVFISSRSQNLSYTCPRDTILGCGAPCMTLKGQFPDLRSLSTDYTFKNVSATSQCLPYIDPGAPGPSASLTIDDRYSAVLNLPFSFPFYGITYNSLVASANGYLSFDVTLAAAFSAWSLAAGDVPNATYDKSLIMGPWHDLDPSVPNSPTHQIKYEVFGAAPNRKWILSFYKVPLFQCNAMIENTHQIILHESTGVIEVFIKDKEICATWNGGEAMVGLQDDTRTKGIMATGRRASDPPWGNIGMNETWRFIPSQGPTLYRSVELLDMTGTTIAIGDTTRVDANTFETSFPNICPPPGTSLYVIKTTYQKIDDPTPGATIYSLDTINVTKSLLLPATAIPTQTACGASTGTITVTANAGVAPYTFTLTPGPIVQVSPTNSTTFINLPAGAFHIDIADGAACTGFKDTTVTNALSLTGTYTQTGTSCPGVDNGSLTITPDLGAAAGPYTFTLTGPGGPFTQVGVVSTATFPGLAGGTYSVTFINAGGCTGAINNMVVAAGATPTGNELATNTTCNGANDGTVTITPTGGAAAGPYNITLNPGGYVQNGVATTAVFTGLPPNTYTATFTNAAGCIGTITFIFVFNGPAPTGTFSSTNTSCAGATDGSVTITPSGGSALGPYNITLNPGGYVQNGVVTTATFVGLPANSYTATFTNAAGCVGTIGTAIVFPGIGPTGTFSSTNTTCSGASDGTVTITPNGGAAQGPYNITLNPGGYVQNGVATAATFVGLPANSYTATFTNAAGCVGNVGPAIVSPGIVATGSFSSTNTTCSGANDGTVTITPNGGAAQGPYNITLNPGGYVQNGVALAATFPGLAANTYTATFTNVLGCNGTVGPVTVTDGPVPTGTFSSTNTTCPGVDDGTVTITPNGGAAQGPYNITLNPGGIVQNGVALAATFPGLAPNTYTATFTNTFGCNGTVGPVTISAGPAVTGTAVATATSCPTVNNGTITVTPDLTATGPFVYTLTGPGGPYVSVPSPSPYTFTGLAPGVYTVTFVTAPGCNGTVALPVTVDPGPFLTSTNTPVNPPCANINDGTITITPTSGVPLYTYTLTGPGGPVTQPSPIFTNLAPGTYNYSFTDGNGCTGTNAVPIILTTNSPITFTSITLTQPLCNGNANGIITLVASGGVPSYLYALSPFATWQPTGVFNGLIAGTYTFRVKDNVGCTKDTTVTLGEPLLLTATSVAVSTTCLGNDGTITVTGHDGTPAYTYSIDNGVTYQASPVFTVPPGPYNFIKVKDANGCTADAIDTVHLVDNMFLSLGPDSTICAGRSVRFEPVTNPETSIFLWSSLNAPISTIDTVYIMNATAIPLDTSIYVLHAEMGFCNRTDSITLFVLHKPIANAGPDQSICNYTDSTLLTGNATNLSGPIKYLWAPAALVRTDSVAITFAILDTTQMFFLTVTDDYGHGCNFSDTDSMTVIVKAPVPANAGNDTLAILGVPHQLFGSGGTQYLWSPSAPLNNPFSPTPTATLFADTKFILLVTDEGGCIAYDTVFVKVYEGPTYYVPNAFSPNGDGLNDIFRAIPVGISNTEYFRVFNRYGELVFETNQWLKGWDGKYKGKIQGPGAYVWMVKGTDKNGRTVEMKGTVLIVQ